MPTEALLGDRGAVLGAADVADRHLAAMAAAALGVPTVELVSSTAEEFPYDLDALTTAGRYVVTGRARHDGTEETFRLFVKVVQSWRRSPVFQFVPEEQRAAALAMIPWGVEPAVYRSDLRERLPAGLTMPTAHAVVDVDEESAALWLEMIETEGVRWDDDRFTRAAYLLGRLAASGAVAPVAALVDRGGPLHRGYASGRLAQQVLPLLRSDVWQHPLVSATFDESLRADLLAAAASMPSVLDELDDMPVVTLHGDACSRNLLVARDRPDEFVLIDFGFWGRGPVGFDLGQLLLGEVQMGERPAADLPHLEEICVPAYLRGLDDEGLHVSPDLVRRSHALLMLEFAGLSAVPFEHLDGPPSPDRLRIAADRALTARFVLDLVAETAASG